MMTSLPPSNSQKGFLSIIIIFLILIIAGLALVGGLLPSKRITPIDPNLTLTLEDFQTEDSKPLLQLQSLKFKQETGANPPPTDPNVPPSCAKTITVDFLVDKSGSMGSFTPTGIYKIIRVKEALLALTNKLDESSILGIQSFRGLKDSRNNVLPPRIVEDVPISYYKSNVRSLIQNRFRLEDVGDNTPMYDGLRFSLEKLRNAIPNFPGRNFKFILLSDGQPTPNAPPKNQPLGTPNNSQDPRHHSPNPADEIKALGVEIFTIGVFDVNESTNLDNSPLARLLKELASSPNNYYQAENADELESLINIISDRFCS